MKRIQTHLQHHLAFTHNFRNIYGVEIFSDGTETITLQCDHPNASDGSVIIWMSSVGVDDLITRFGLRKFDELQLITPEQLRVVFDGQHLGRLYVLAGGESKPMECSWKNKRLHRVDNFEDRETVPYDPQNLLTLIQHAKAVVSAVTDVV